ncbi:MAG TPA: hypothetical protein VLG71_02130 [Candidatus Limnocylindria bacterium]|nr:hypothetical protein [Candidatus Limnocylindria bacterium]
MNKNICALTLVTMLAVTVPTIRAASATVAVAPEAQTTATVATFPHNTTLTSKVNKCYLSRESCEGLGAILITVGLVSTFLSTLDTYIFSK